MARILVTDEDRTNDPTRCRWYLPGDPGWVDRDAVRRIREEIRRFNSLLQLWWIPGWKVDDPVQPGRWAVMWFMRRQSQWSVVFYLENAGGGYMAPSVDMLDVILRTLREGDSEQVGRGYKDRTRAEIESEERKKRESRAEVNDATIQSSIGMFRAKRGKFVVGPGSKGDSHADRENRDPVFDALVKKKKLE